TCPRITSSTSDGSMPARSTAAWIAMAPRSGAVNGARPPRNRPIGVRAALTITAVRDGSNCFAFMFPSPSVGKSDGGENLDRLQHDVLPFVPGVAPRGRRVVCEDQQPPLGRRLRENL